MHLKRETFSYLILKGILSEFKVTIGLKDGQDIGILETLI